MTNNTLEKEKDITIFILSDGTGETASSITRAVLVQYENDNVQIVKHTNIRSKKQLHSLLVNAELKKSIVTYTFVLDELRNEIQNTARQKNIPSIDLLGPLIETFNQHLSGKPEKKAGILHQVDEDYFKRIEAVEFSLKCDDGAAIKSLHRADIVLVGVSRTSKTPLSIFLSYKGYKTANIPFVKDILLPEELLEVDSKKIIALTIDEETLFKIRRIRLQKMGVKNKGEYADRLYIHHELEQAKSCFEKYRWPVVNVTDRALEETAADILRIIHLRQPQKN